MISQTYSKSRVLFHFLAAFVVCVWGTTFVATKLLISYGLTASDIFFYRFLIAYIGIWFFAPHKLFADNLKDEATFFLLGITGGSLYFLAENTALYFTLASNVALIISTTPILTAIITRIVYPKNKLGKHFGIGSFLAIAGVALVVLNGSYILQMNPLGDILTLVAALTWAIYSLLIKRMNNRYQLFFISRKIFFYGLLSILPYYFFRPLQFDVTLLTQPVIWGNLLFLGVLASLICYTVWNIVIDKLGIVSTTNYIYFIPLITLFTSAIVIDEHITWIAFLGAIMILSGVYFASKKSN